MMRHSVHLGRLRALLAAGAALGAFAVAPTAADAASVGYSNGAITYTAAKDEANHLTVAPWGLALKLTDTGTKGRKATPIAVTAAAGCWQVASNAAACPGAAATAVNVNLGDGDDFIDAADGKVDTIACGAGNDSGTAETGDSVAADCESVTKPAPTTEPAPLLPITDPITDPVIDPPTNEMPVNDPEAPIAPAANSVPPTIPAQTVGVSPSGVATVRVSCPPDSGGCTGVVAIELPVVAASRHAKVVSGARRTPAIKLGQAKFKAAAGTTKTVAVRLSKRGRQRILRGRRTRRARITVTTRSGSGKTSVISQDVTIRPSPKVKRRR
ncbi:MAG: hypothetical protein QOI19_556 [Thermoleophilaceae bacterium]|nr:hypothetical protein [Thermoleophilaceae bacterium]